MNTLDLDAVAAFVLVADLRSFTRAAAILDTTQASVSLRIKRLEQSVGHRLLDRTPRLVKLSTDGAAFLGAARALVEAHRRAREAFSVEPTRLRLGISDHLVGADLPILLKRLGTADPSLVVDLDVAPSRAVLEAFAAGRSEAAIVLRHDDRRDGLVIGRERLIWVAAADFTVTDPLRIATHTEACSVRTLALRALDSAGIAWTEAFTGGGLGTVGAAVSAGLAIAAMARRTAPPGCEDVGRRLGLPALPSLEIAMHSGTTDSRIRTALKTLAVAFQTPDQIV